jgi:putative colanic acid biosynthesis acetyltransferase WcaF
MFNLEKFKVPADFRGRSLVYVQIWRTVNFFLFKTSPQFMWAYRRFLLRLFGAKIGKGVLIRSSVDIIYPWNLEIGSHSWIGHKVTLYTLGPINIGENTVISQFSHLCAGGHNYRSPQFDITGLGIQVGSGVWIASDVFINDGVCIGNNSIIGARATILKDVPSNFTCLCKHQVIMKERE